MGILKEAIESPSCHAKCGGFLVNFDEKISKLEKLVSVTKENPIESNLDQITSFIWREIEPLVKSPSTREILSGKTAPTKISPQGLICDHQTFLRGLSHFGVPFEEWSPMLLPTLSLLEEQLQNLTTPIEKLKGFQDVENERTKLWNKFSDDPRFREAFRDPLSR